MQSAIHSRSAAWRLQVHFRHVLPAGVCCSLSAKLSMSLLLVTCPACYKYATHCRLCSSQRLGNASGLNAAPAIQPSRRPRQPVKTRAANILLDVVGSGVGGAVAAAASTFTSENREAEIERLQTPDVSSLLDHIAWTDSCACRAQELPAASMQRAPSCMHAAAAAAVA